MPSTNLKPGDPLVLTLAADARFGPTSYTDDHIWELSLGSGEPPSLAVQTTYGLRARSFRIFPRFIIKDKIYSDPATFSGPVQIKYLAPNFIRLACFPFQGINVEIEYWVPTSQTLAGRARIINAQSEPATLSLEWAAVLTPDASGQRMAPMDIGLSHLLAGKTSNLTPVLYLTGIVQQGLGPYPALSHSLELEPHETRTSTWVSAAMATPEMAFAQARQIATRKWDAETAHLELMNSGQLEIHTGIPDWDTAFMLAQKTARGLVTTNPAESPFASSVSTRLPDQGYSLRGDGSDYNHLWDGQTLFDLYYLCGLLLPGEAELVRGFLKNFLEAQSADGDIPYKPGLVGQPSRLTAPPILAALVWRYYQHSGDRTFRETSFPRLLAFLHSWFSPQHDRDGDGIPEWDHPLQTGLDDHPVYAHWHPWAQGVDISMVEGPDLCSYLYSEIQALIQIAQLVERPETIPALKSLGDNLVAAVEANWDEPSATYQAWDRESHHSSSLTIVGQRQGPGTIQVSSNFDQPVRLLIHLRSKDETTRPAQGFIHGTGPSGVHRVERVSSERFRWQLGIGRYTSERIYTHLEHIDVQGILEADTVTIQTPHLRCREQTCLLPLWAGIPSPERGTNLISKTITNSKLFWGKHGLRACAEKTSDPSASSHYQHVHPLWNMLIGEGLLRYGKQKRAADLVTRLMEAVVLNLKQKHSFFRAYSATDGNGIGERDALLGLAPLGLFLQVLGVQIISPYQVKIIAPNPFPWPVTVKYKGLTVIQHKKKALVIFPDGQNVNLRNDKPQIVSLPR